MVRHGESEGNAQAAFSGWRDVALTELGGAQA
ncbi:MAG: bisphosphoglycerate-dependent phosphoglycerate mutase, partial [Planctomycetota bacterium]